MIGWQECDSAILSIAAIAQICMLGLLEIRGPFGEMPSRLPLFSCGKKPLKTFKKQSLLQ